MHADYSLTAELLADSLPGISPAELHGLLAGQLCSGIIQPDPDDLGEILEHELLPVVKKLVERLGQEANAQLGGLEYSFHPLLPDDEQTLAYRVTELGQWCNSFTAGFAAGYIRPESDLTSEAREILQDFAELADLSDAEHNVDEQDEEDYMELVEYVRMAAITLYQQLVGNHKLTAGEDQIPPGQLLH